MAIGTTVSRNDYIGNGATDTYDYEFKINNKNDIQVIKRLITTGVETILVVDTDYTVVGVGETAGGSITLTAGNLASTFALTLRREVDLTQETDIRNSGDIYLETVEDTFDKLAMADMQQQDEIDRSMRLPKSIDPTTFDGEFPAGMVGEANKVPLTNAAGNGWAAATEWPSANTIASAETSATAAAASAVASSASATASSTSATNAAASAVAAATAAASVIWNDVVFINVSNSPYSVTSSQRGKMIAVDASGGAVAITMPQISGISLATPYVVGIKKTDSSGNAVTISRSGTDTIDGLTSLILSTPDTGAAFIPDTDTTPDEWTTAQFGASAGNMTIDTFTGTGAQTAFVLSVDPGTENNTWVYVDGIHQHKDTYIVAGTTLTFSEAPPNGAAINVVSGTTLSIGTPSDGTVTFAKLANQVVQGATTVTAATGDFVLVADTSDSGNVKKVLVSDFGLPANLPSGALVQVQHALTTAVVNASTSIPYDDTIPQITEGTEVLTCSITPKSASNKLKITISTAVVSNANGRDFTVALFQDATANALAARNGSTSAANYVMTANLVHYMDAGTTSATTFRFRFGLSVAEAWTINGQSSARKMGGVCSTTITIEEIKV